MYKLLICWRYLRTRYIALASIVSVTLGVATMIVVNSVMSGFTTEMQHRIHGILSDVIVEARSLGGVPDPEARMEQIRSKCGNAIAGMTATVVVPGMLNYRYGENWITRQVQIIGIDAETQSQVSDFSKYLQHPKNRERMSFDLRPDGYDTRDHQSGDDAHERPQMGDAGWKHRQWWAETRAFTDKALTRKPFDAPSGQDSPAPAVEDPFHQGQPAASADPPKEVDPTRQQHPGVVMGIILGSYRDKQGDDKFLVLPGEDVILTVPTASPDQVKASSLKFTVVDFYESKMSEYDSSFVFVPIHELQEMRGMYDRQTGRRYFNSIQIKLAPGVDGDAIRDQLKEVFPSELYVIQTWRDKQGALLSAVQVESAILNVLLFMIIAVSGFGILAIFFMIVVEKTRDIGILKSLGASSGGILGIFLAYGLSLGLVGSGAGLGLGLLIVHHINLIADWLSKLTGKPVFDPSIYYFYKIPTLVDPWTVGWIVAGTLTIAVLASVLPALRAATLHPVEALRYE
jgi:lipoprotein-releasing system permease protein